MKRSDLEMLSTEELWVLHEKVATTLNAKIRAQKKVLEDRLAQLNGRFSGKKPRRLTAQLKSGKPIDDFRIDLATAEAAE